MGYHSQVGQDRWVCEHFNFKRGGYFLDIGANDGLQLSNTLTLEKELGWNGLCIEPGRHAFAKLNKNRRYALNVAISNKDEHVQFNEVGLIGCIDPAGTQGIEALTLRTLFTKYNPPTLIDYVSLDIEGGEYNALCGFPWDTHQVILWTIEHNMYVDGGVQKAKIKRIMENKGYVIVKSDVDYMEDWWINTKYNGLDNGRTV